MKTQTSKIFKNRDSATAALKKVGIAKADYARFISKTADGKFKCDINTAIESLLPPAKAVKRKMSHKETVSAVARALVLAGNDNAEIWSVLQKRFGLDDKKRGYPAWYRNELRRKGQLAA